jgi:UDP-2,4-diacetamido-2,4,6-trideoxy-beta-L-altropyranose hydrolase
MSSARNVIIRADSSVLLGSGHIMRTLALAQALAANRYKVRYLCQELPGNLINEIESRGFQVDKLIYESNSSMTDSTIDTVTDAKATLSIIEKYKLNPVWLIVDHYGIDSTWHELVASCGAAVAVIDDLADRSLSCDLLIDQNQIPSIHTRYKKMTRRNCVKLFGPEYTLLREEFREIHRIRSKHCSSLDAEGVILVFLGGADELNLTIKVLELCSKVSLSGRLHVLTGSMNQSRIEIINWCEKNSVDYSSGHSDMRDILCNAKAAIVACGMFAVELQALQIPSLLIPLSPIQNTVANHFSSMGRALVLHPEELDQEKYFSSMLNKLWAITLTPAGLASVPVDGALRIVKKMQEMHP